MLLNGYGIDIKIHKKFSSPCVVVHMQSGFFGHSWNRHISRSIIHQILNSEILEILNLWNLRVQHFRIRPKCFKVLKTKGPKGLK